VIWGIFRHPDNGIERQGYNETVADYSIWGFQPGMTIYGPPDLSIGI
jgi:hypothetical protein